MNDKTIVTLGFICVLVIFPAIVFLTKSADIFLIVPFGVIAAFIVAKLLDKFHITWFEGRFRRY
jgi:hypothetical protein